MTDLLAYVLAPIVAVVIFAGLIAYIADEESREGRLVGSIFLVAYILASIGIIAKLAPGIFA